MYKYTQNYTKTVIELNRTIENRITSHIDLSMPFSSIKEII